jgi:hypothetical protein
MPQGIYLSRIGVAPHLLSADVLTHYRRGWFMACGSSGGEGGSKMALLHSHGHEVRIWALMALLGVATLIAGCILWAKISGF